MESLLRRALAVLLVLAAWAVPAAAAPRAHAPADAGRDVTLGWDGTAWVEVSSGHPATRVDPGDEDGDVTLYWNDGAWVKLPPGVELRYSHLTGSSREVAEATTGPDRVSAPAVSEADASAARSWLARVPDAPARAASEAPAWAAVGPAASPGRAGEGAEASAAAPRAVGIAALGGGDGADTAGTPPATPVATAAEASTSASLSLVGLLHDGLTRTGSEFQFTSLRDLRIVVDWANLPGAANVQRLEVLGPDGKLYQKFTTSIASVRTETQMPVGGTWITQHELAGAWRVQVYLNRDSSPVATRGFRLSR